MKNNAKCCYVLLIVVVMSQSVAHAVQSHKIIKQCGIVKFIDTGEKKILDINNKTEFMFCTKKGKSGTDNRWRKEISIVKSKTINTKRSGKKGKTQQKTKEYVVYEYQQIHNVDLLEILERVSNGIDVIMNMIEIQGVSNEQVKQKIVDHNVNAGHCGCVFGNNAFRASKMKERVDNRYAKEACIRIFDRDNDVDSSELHIGQMEKRGHDAAQQQQQNAAQQQQRIIDQRPKSMWIFPKNVYAAYDVCDFVNMPYSLIAMRNRDCSTSDVEKAMLEVCNAVFVDNALLKNIEIYDGWQESKKKDGIESIYMWKRGVLANMWVGNGMCGYDCAQDGKYYKTGLFKVFVKVNDGMIEQVGMYPAITSKGIEEGKCVQML